jgi:hypothetical protein
MCPVKTLVKARRHKLTLIPAQSLYVTHRLPSDLLPASVNHVQNTLKTSQRDFPHSLRRRDDGVREARVV